MPVVQMKFLAKHICNEVDRYGKKEAGTGEHSTILIK